jgi:TRAP-type uncharacterized transport system substrate-binding protein
MSDTTTLVRLGTATPGGGFPLYGGVLAEVVNATDPTLRVEPRHTKGSTENVPLLEAGEIDLGLVQGEVAHESLAGIGRPPARLLILAAMYSTPGMFVARGDSPYRSIADLRGQRIAFGARGSGLVILSRYVLDGLGLAQDTDFDAVYLDRAGDGPAMVMDGRVAALWGGGTGARILQRHAFLKPLTAPAGGYPGQEAPIASVGSWSFVMTRPDLEEHTAYRLARALHRGEDRLAAALDQARETRAENTLRAAPDSSLIHPGARRYLREIGLG